MATLPSPLSEVVYGTKEEGHVMSDKVSQLASSVYSEFEKMIKKYDEDVVKELMPLVVGILESLDQAYLEKQECDVEMELLREDNEQLLTQYEREKQLRKAADQKYLEMEDENEEWKKESEEKIESLESVQRMMELKNKNASDHLTRMEEKEAEMKKEYNKVHERYTELMRTHMDYMERAKMLMGSDRLADMANSPRASIDKGNMYMRKASYGFGQMSNQFSPRDLGGFQLPNLKHVNMINMTGSTPLKSTGSPPDASTFDMMSPRSGKDSNVSLKSELSDLESPDINSNTGGRQVTVTTNTSDKEQNTDRVDVREFATATKTKQEGTDTPAAHPVSEENTDKSDKSDTQVNDASDNVFKESEPPSNLVIEGETSKTIEKSETLTKPEIVISEDSKTILESVKPSEEVSESSEHVTKINSERVTEASIERSEDVIGIDSGSSVIRKPSSPREKKKDKADKRKSRELPKAEPSPQSPQTPDSPMAPFFESGDFAYEEDEMPGLDNTLAHIKATTPELDDMEVSTESGGSANHERTPKRNDASIFEEMTIQDPDLIGDVDYGADITGRVVNPADYASSDDEDEQDETKSNVSDNFFGMSRELENLILENTELLATKNALNIVKDDLIAKVDELTSEQEIVKEELSSLKAGRTKLQERIKELEDALMKTNEQEIVKEELNSLKAGRTKLQERIKELEDELKKTKEDLDKKSQQAQEGEGTEDDVPMAQRKRFTRVEMARVLMERNQYKERLMELQEAVRWTEMIRASREHPEINPSKKKSSIWNFFSNLFSSPDKPKKKPLPMAMVKYNAPTTNVQPVGDPNQKERGKYKMGDKSKAYDFLQDDLKKSLGEPIVSQPNTSEKAKKEREKERKEQYKQVRAHVKKDDGRMQAYGWSLPAKFVPQVTTAPSKSAVPVPVPIYCRPLLDEETGLKIWCAAGVNLTGGKTKDGGSIVGASVFYSETLDSATKLAIGDSEVDKLDQEIHDHEENVKQSDREQLSSFVWICTSTHTQSCVSVIDANHPGDILATFRVSTTPVLCIASVPGALESDYSVDEDILKAESYPQYPEPSTVADSNKDKDKDKENKDKDGGEDTGIGGVSFVQCATGGASPVGSPPKSRDGSPDRSNITEAVSEALSKQEDNTSVHSGSSSNISEGHSAHGSSQSLNKRASLDSLLLQKRASQCSNQSTGETTQPTVFKAKGEPAASGTATPEMSGGIASRRVLKEPSDMVKDGINALATGSNLQNEEVEKMSSVLPTMWMGTQSGSLYVHSSVSQWRRCLHSVKLRDSILNIVHVKGRVLAALADGTVAIFHRHTDGQWDLQNYHLLDLGKPHHSIRCMTVIANKHVWCGYRNKIHVVDPQSMSIWKSFDAHPRKESQVRQLAWVGDGVWVSIRLDSTLRLYHAYTHQHLQDVDIEPYVSKMLGTGKLGFSFVRITSMLVSCNRLWIGTGNGVIISVPLSENNKQAVSMSSSIVRPGGLVRVYSDQRSDSITPGSFIPYCTMAQAQLSFHGHRDAVKFFVAVPGKKRKGISHAADTTEEEEGDTSKGGDSADDKGDNLSRLVLSGGEGYVDFRIGLVNTSLSGDGDPDDILMEDPEEKEEKTLSKGDRSHLIVWEVSSPE